MLLSRLASTIAVVAIAATPARAMLVTSLPNATAFTLGAYNINGPGPYSDGSGNAWQSTDTSGVLGWTSPYSFGANGSWSGTPMIGTGGATTQMTLTFGTGYAAVGGFMSYMPGGPAPVIAAYNAQGALIDSATMSFLTGGGANTGAFYGFSEAAPVIRKLVLSNASIGMKNIVVQATPTPIPEPGTLALLGGLAALAVARRRRA